MNGNEYGYGYAKRVLGENGSPSKLSQGLNYDWTRNLDDLKREMNRSRTMYAGYSEPPLLYLAPDLYDNTPTIWRQGWKTG
jgi:hypothetical protein